jgi:hypothetical protein
MNAADPDRMEEFCEWFHHKVHEMSKIVWSDEVTFKNNGAVNRHNCVCWATVA